MSISSPLLTRAWRAYGSREFGVFLIFGGTAALVNLVVGMACYNNLFVNQLPYGMSVLIGAAAGLVVNFGLNYVFNFKFHGRSAWAQFRTFIVIATLGTLLTGALASLFLGCLQALARYQPLLDHAAADRFLAHVGAIGVVTFYSYAAHKYFSFNVGIRQRLFKGK